MAITIELPKEIEDQLKAAWNGDLPRKALEALVVEAYREELISHGKAAEVLGLSFNDAAELLKEKKAYLHYDEEDLKQDLHTLHELLGK